MKTKKKHPALSPLSVLWKSMSSLSFSIAFNTKPPKTTTRRRRRRRRASFCPRGAGFCASRLLSSKFFSLKQSSSSSTGRRRQRRCDFFVGTNGSQNRHLCVVEATTPSNEEENGGSANMSARELKRALEEMVRRRLVSNFSLPLSVFVFVRFVRIESWRTRQRGRRRRLLGAGKRNVDD